MRIGGPSGVFRGSSHQEPDVERLFAEAVAAMSGESESKSLVQTGLGVVIRWLSKS